MIPSRPQIGPLLDGLVDRGTLSAEQREALGTLALDEDRPPWFVRLLVGLGAWVSAALFLLFAFLAQLISSEAGAIGCGALLLVATSLTRRHVTHDFWVQLILAGSLAGQALLIGGVGGAAESLVAGAICALVVEALLLWWVPDPVLRFFAAAAMAGALLALCIEAEARPLFDLLLVGLAVGGGLLWLAPARLHLGRFGELRLPAAYAWLLFALGLLVADVVMGIEHPGDHGLLLGWPATTGLTAALIALELAILRRLGQPLGSEATLVIAVASGLLALATWSTPGVIASLGLFGLAMQRRSWVLFGIAVLFLVGFTVLFYYNLQVTLLLKSATLGGSGLLLWGLRAYLVWRLPPGAEGEA